MTNFNTIVLGGGAAGLMCAAIASQRGKSVLVLEHASEVGKKILISGGGRCNFTNLNVLPKCFLSKNPHFAKSALSRYTQHDFIALVQRHNIAYHEKTLGQLFCDGSARGIVNMLLDECAQGGADIRLNHEIKAISHNGNFAVETSHGNFTCANLVVATGGPAIPKMKATGFAYDIARQFKHKIIEPLPALVPLKTSQQDLDFVLPLAGIALDSIVSMNKTKFRENILFTHRGFSGPAILQISSYWKHGDTIHLNLLPEIDALLHFKERKQSRPKAELKTILAEILPARLAHAIAGQYPASTFGTIPDKTLQALATQLHKWQFTPSGSEGFAKAEVTLGGVDTAGLSSQTMESQTVKGLYFIGEAVDVTGWLGGYNFQWAWSSGWVAGQSV